MLDNWRETVNNWDANRGPQNLLTQVHGSSETNEVKITKLADLALSKIYFDNLGNFSGLAFIGSKN